VIPERIYVEGFLCYREPQEAHFGGYTLWMLAGPNGSGKSALFDAVTFALYGQHRGGRHQARGLINRERDGFVVEFDFLIDDRRYRARRTLSRLGRPTRQLYQYDSEAEPGLTMWRELPETHTEQGFTDWVREHVALTYETFTASVLLLQGKADNLLLASPAQRHALLCQVVGVERFELMEQRARQHLAEAQGAVANLNRQLKLAPRVTREQLHAFRQAVERAGDDDREATARVEQWKCRVEQAELWTELQRRHGQLEEAIDACLARCKQLEDLDARHDRLTLLRESADKLATLCECRARIAQCRLILERETAEQDRLRGEAAMWEREAAERECLLQRAEQQLERSLARHQCLLQQRADTTVALSPLQRLARVRERLRDTRQKVARLNGSRDRWCREHDAIAAAVPTTEELAAARGAAQEARQQLVRDQASARQIRQQLERFQSVAGEQTCRYCRQLLPESHVCEERARLAREVAAAQQRAAEAERMLASAEKQSRTREHQLAALQTQRTSVEDRLREAAAELHACRQLDDECCRQCAEAYQELPGDYRHRLAPDTPHDWAATTYPTPEELASLAETQRTVEAELRETAGDISRQKSLATELTAARRRAAEQQPPRTGRIQQLAVRHAEMIGELRRLRELEVATCDKLPPEWRDGSPEALAAQLRELEREQASVRALAHPAGRTALHDTRVRLDSLIGQRQVVLDQQQQIPAEARCDSGSARQALEAAIAAARGAATARREAASAETRATEHARQYRLLADELRANDRQRALWHKLARLLDREHLQYEMLRTAERAIVDYANVILDRLTCGQLHVELRGRGGSRVGSARVLELIARTAASAGGYQDVAFLSGSQKFRVAVGLSLAIGQFASRTRRPVQAVIIDEGFGCLDSVNRQVMIQELQNLRSYLRRILLVSHQDEFASAFPDGYRCEIIDGASRLTPFHR